MTEFVVNATIILGVAAFVFGCAMLWFRQPGLILVGLGVGVFLLGVWYNYVALNDRIVNPGANSSFFVGQPDSAYATPLVLGVALVLAGAGVQLLNSRSKMKALSAGGPKDEHTANGNDTEVPSSSSEQGS